MCISLAGVTKKIWSIIICVSAAVAARAQQPLLLNYDRPAANWNEALPIGNGRLGAMVFGGIQEERLQLNEETVWAGEPGNNIPPHVYDSIVAFRKLLFSKKYKEA